ncbi:Histamine N-methyltransferase A [Holothuria leucospilota]|uniref:Histamine N-methyltransferase A n=1 Tax=Holothuria leucospilota TaxID=206669 RepID=A0A9Q1GZD1_HOLLE|nr:Histamine N-methyltransferase A [Holothuria leucospilota]
MAPPASPSLAEGPASKRTARHPSASNARAPLPARNPASVRPLSRPSPAKGLAPPLQSPLRSSISALGKDDVSRNTLIANSEKLFSLLEGIVEVKMLKQLMKKFRLVECTVVEPSGEQITSYKKLVEEQKDALNGVTFDWRQETIQEFCKANADGSKKFHFVSALHSCYYIAKQDLDFYLNTFCEWTKGKILIMLGSVAEHFNLPGHALDLKVTLIASNFVCTENRKRTELIWIMKLKSHLTGLNKDLGLLNQYTFHQTL